MMITDGVQYIVALMVILVGYRQELSEVILLVYYFYGV